MIITIPGSLPTLNEYINAERSNKHLAAKMKKTYTDICAYSFIRATRPEGSAYFAFRWYRKDKRADPDNVAFAKKFIFDGMVKAKFLVNDGWTQVSELHDEFFIDKKNPRVEIIILENVE